jgi:hypothetical protein
MCRFSATRHPQQKIQNELILLIATPQVIIMGEERCKGYDIREHLPHKGRAGLPKVQVRERRQEVPAHGRILLPTLQIFLEDGLSNCVS